MSNTADLSLYAHRSPVDKVLSKLLLKILASGQRAVVVCPDAESLRDLDISLWVFSKSELIPHGQKEDGNPELQPVWLSCEIENPNNASILILIDPQSVPETHLFSKVILFSPLNEHTVTKWPSVKTWVEQEQGNWVAASEKVDA
jgi:DNA polymerase-3 subunit chi